MENPSISYFEIEIDIEIDIYIGIDIDIYLTGHHWAQPSALHTWSAFLVILDSS